MGEVVELPVVTTLDLPVERVIDAARDAKLRRIVIIGETEDGAEYFKSSVADGGYVVWMLERAKLKLLRLVD